MGDWTADFLQRIHKTDSTGKSFTFVEVSIDDVVRIGGIGGSAAFKITSSATQSGDVYEFDVQLLSHTGVMAEILAYDFEFLNAFDPSAYEYVDAQDDLDVKLAGCASTGFRIKNGSYFHCNRRNSPLPRQRSQSYGQQRDVKKTGDTKGCHRQF